jgi:uncharacterized membrane protein
VGLQRKRSLLRLLLRNNIVSSCYRTDMADKEADVPKELQQHKKDKQMAEERAEEEINKHVTRGEAFLSSIGYIGFLCVLPLVLMPKSKFAQFHGKQALVLAILIYFLDVLEVLPTTVEALYTLLKYGVILFAAYSAFNAKLIRIPFVYDLSTRFQIHVQKDGDGH